MPEGPGGSGGTGEVSDIARDDGASGSRELLIDLRGVPRGRLGAELERQIRDAIRSGRLRPGARLPSTRTLAADLGVSRSVVVQAFEQLAAEGYLTTRPGAVARVSNVVIPRTGLPPTEGYPRPTSAVAGVSDMTPTSSAQAERAGTVTRPAGGTDRPRRPLDTRAGGVGLVHGDGGRLGSVPEGGGAVARPEGTRGLGIAGRSAPGGDVDGGVRPRSGRGGSGGPASSTSAKSVGATTPPVGGTDQPPRPPDTRTGGVDPDHGAGGRVGSVHGRDRAGGVEFLGAKVEVDLRPGSPNLTGLPRAEWGRAVRRALATLTDAELGYGDSRGLPRLREALADYLGRVRGAIVDPEHLVVVNGFAQGLVVMARLLRERGVTAVAVEDPGSVHTATHLVDQGVAVVPVPVDDQGLDIDRLRPDGGSSAGAVSVDEQGLDRLRPDGGSSAGVPVDGHGLGIERLGPDGGSSAGVPVDGHGLGIERLGPEGGWSAGAVPVDGHGLDIRRLSPGGHTPPGAVLVTPAHQFPTGAVLSPARRLGLVEWAERHDALVIEDDYDAEYRYDHHAVGALQGMAPDRVVLGGSVSKTLAPGLRLGWLAVPPALSARAARHKAAIDLMAPVLEQAALAELITSGSYERHIRRSRAAYKRRRDLVVELIADELPDADVRGASAGLHLLVMTPSVDDEGAVEREAARRGVGVMGLGRHRHAPGPPGFVLGYGHLTDDQLRRALQTFAATVHQRPRPREQ